MSEKTKKIIVEICRFLLGFVFIFSGFVKAVDPLGSAYKFHDYFIAFGTPWFDIMSLPGSFIQSAIEFSVGVCIILGVYRKATSFMILAIMLFMTPLTLYLAIKNPVTDCGCFGDALVITNWETFYKNIFLLAASILLFCWHKRLWSFFTPKSQWIATLYTYLFIFGIMFYCYKYLPILDFRPYKIGANIPELMKMPEGALSDEYETTFIYEKNGEKKEFTLENYPAEDSTWTFVDSKSKLIKKGYTPPIHDFTITTMDGEEITDQILSDTSYTFLLISHKLDKADDSNVDQINEIYDFSQQNGYKFYCLSASNQDQILHWTQDTGAEYPMCTTDEITLKTIIRSNPGLMLLNNGIIYNKWSHNRLPSENDLTKPLAETDLGKIANNNDAKELTIAGCLLLIPLALFFVIDYLRYRKNQTNKQI